MKKIQTKIYKKMSFKINKKKKGHLVKYLCINKDICNNRINEK